MGRRFKKMRGSSQSFTFRYTKYIAKMFNNVFGNFLSGISLNFPNSASFKMPYSISRGGHKSHFLV